MRSAAEEDRALVPVSPRDSAISLVNYIQVRLARRQRRVTRRDALARPRASPAGSCTSVSFKVAACCARALLGPQVFMAQPGPGVAFAIAAMIRGRAARMPQLYGTAPNTCICRGSLALALEARLGMRRHEPCGGPGCTAVHGAAAQMKGLGVGRWMASGFTETHELPFTARVSTKIRFLTFLESAIRKLRPISTDYGIPI